MVSEPLDLLFAGLDHRSEAVVLIYQLRELDFEFGWNLPNNNKNR